MVGSALAVEVPGTITPRGRGVGKRWGGCGEVLTVWLTFHYGVETRSSHLSLSLSLCWPLPVIRPSALTLYSPSPASSFPRTCHPQAVLPWSWRPAALLTALFSHLSISWEVWK